MISKDGGRHIVAAAWPWTPTVRSGGQKLLFFPLHLLHLLNEDVADILAGLEGGAVQDDNIQNLPHDGNNLTRLVVQMEITKYRKESRMYMYNDQNDPTRGYSNPLL